MSHEGNYINSDEDLVQNFVEENFALLPTLSTVDVSSPPHSKHTETSTQ